jgi:hypothetical protein
MFSIVKQTNSRILIKILLEQIILYKTRYAVPGIARGFQYDKNITHA